MLIKYILCRLGQEGLIEKSVFANYIRNIRPVVSGNDTVHVRMAFILGKIEKLESGEPYICETENVDAI